VSANLAIFGTHIAESIYNISVLTYLLRRR